MIAVTGGLGFIGSAFVRRAVGRGEIVLNVDISTYAADDARLAGCSPEYLTAVAVDVAETDFHDVLAEHRPSALVHFAAESHVTRSEATPELFFRTNVEGTRNVFDAAVAAGVGLVVHVSTDEVYGPCEGTPFGEGDKLPGEGLATSAYARSKALADDIAVSFRDRVPTIVVRPTNCFGPWQHPEKAIPRWITRALSGKMLPVWGDGCQTRDWMLVEDACAAIEVVMTDGVHGEVYNIGPEGEQIHNLDLARKIAQLSGRPEEDVYLTDYDRPDHDRRYAIDSRKLRALGWHPSSALDDMLRATISWYGDHRDWWERLLPQAEQLYVDAVPRRVGT